MPNYSKTTVYVSNLADPVFEKLEEKLGTKPKLISECNWSGMYAELHYDLLRNTKSDTAITSPASKPLPSNLLITVTNNHSELTSALYAAAYSVVLGRLEAHIVSAGYVQPINLDDVVIHDMPTYAIAYFFLCAAYRLTITSQPVVNRGQDALSYIADNYERCLNNRVRGLVPGNLHLHLACPLVNTKPTQRILSPSWAVEESDRVDSRLIKSLASLFERQPQDREGDPNPDRSVYHPAALQEVAMSSWGELSLRKYLHDFAAVDPINTLDAAVMTEDINVVIKDNFKSILANKSRSYDGVKAADKLKNIFSIASDIANYKIEGRPAYLTLLITADPLKNELQPPTDGAKQLFESKILFDYIDPPDGSSVRSIPLQFRHKRFRNALVSSPSPNIILCASLNSMRIDRCITVRHTQPTDAFRRLYFTVLAAKCRGVVIHTHQSGSVEIYNENELCLLGHGVQWYFKPYEEMLLRCHKFFTGSTPQDAEGLSWRAVGIVANLVEQRASSIMIFTSETVYQQLDHKIVSRMQSDKASPKLCIKKDFMFDDVCRFLQIDGAHVISPEGVLLDHMLRIVSTDPTNAEKGDTGSAAVATIAAKIHALEENNTDSKSFVVKVSGSGCYLLYQHGKQVSTPFDE